MTVPRTKENKGFLLLFTKLKKGGFVVDTPYGHYSPDWAIVYKHENTLKLYFIVESKFQKIADDLTDKEKTKIKCAKLHFKAISEDIQFDWVNSYADFQRKFPKKS